MIGIDSFPMPNDLIDEFLDKKITEQEFVVLMCLYRKAYGGPSPELVKIKDLEQLSNPKRDCKTAARTLKEKGLVDIIYACANCDNVFTNYNSTNYRCGKCKSKETPHLCYILTKKEYFNNGYTHQNGVHLS